MFRVRRREPSRLVAHNIIYYGGGGGKKWTRQNGIDPISSVSHEHDVTRDWFIISSAETVYKYVRLGAAKSATRSRRSANTTDYVRRRRLGRYKRYRFRLLLLRRRCVRLMNIIWFLSSSSRTVAIRRVLFAHAPVARAHVGTQETFGAPCDEEAGG